MAGDLQAAEGANLWSHDNRLRVDGGSVAGIAGTSAEVRVFEGIPYAAPAVGNLRWRPPQPVVPWKGVRKTDAFAPSCPQIRLDPANIFYGEPHPISEDCLYLNVWTAARSTSDHQPVLLWIHDGAFRFGEGTRAVADGEVLSRKGAVVVTINYRLGVFGFLAHPELSRESGHGVSGNYGLLDMIAAIKWTRRNIAAFGGDPDRITIIGESAGGWAASALSTSPLVKGDIHAAIVEDYLFFLGSPRLDASERSGADFAKAVGATSLDELRKLPAEALLSASSKFFAQGHAVGPVIDNWVLTAPNVFAAERDGTEQDIPILTGSNADHGTTLVSPVPAKAFIEQSRKAYGDMADRFLSLYPAASDPEAAASQIDARTDILTWMHNEFAALHAHNGRRSYLYFFTRAPPVPSNSRYNISGDPLPVRLGAYHTGEIAYTFDSLAKLDRPWKPYDHKLADIMSSYWVNFAAKGDPNGPGLPLWPAYGHKPEPVMELGNQVRPIPCVLSKAKSEFWADYFGKMAAQ